MTRPREGSALRTCKIENRGDGQSNAPTFADWNLLPLVGEPRHEVGQPRIPNRLTFHSRIRLRLPTASFLGRVVERTPEQEGDSQCAADVVGSRQLGVMPVEYAANRLFRQPMRKRRTRRRAAREGPLHCRPVFF